MLTIHRYMGVCNFADIPQFANLTMKEQHTIVEKWPMTMKKKFGEQGAEEEFDTLLASLYTGAMRYAEWRKAS